MTPYRLLVVEDEGIVAMDIEHRLAAMGYELAGSTSTGEQAVELAQRERPDLILMDIRLQGDMDGITAAEEIRSRFDLPVIFLTAYSEDSTLARAKLAQPYGYLLKPFDDRDLKSVIEIALYKHGAEKEIRHLNRLYDVLSQVNQAVVYAGSREDLLQTVCRVVVERGAIDLAWIGWLDETTSRILPVAHFGEESRILSEAEFFSNERPEGQGNPGKAIREGKPFVCDECSPGACLYPEAKHPVVYGFRSCGAFPLRLQGRVCGVLALCVAEPGFFREREIDLLMEVVLDISFALDKLEGDVRRERAEAALAAERARLRTLVNTLPAMVWLKDPQGVYLAGNPAFERFMGVKEAELLGKADYDFFPAELAEFFRGHDQNAMLAGKPTVNEEWVTMADDGSRVLLETIKTPMADDQGRLVGVLGIAHDITAMRQVAETLRESEEFKNAIIDSMPSHVAVLDGKGVIVAVNAPWVRFSIENGLSDDLSARRTWAGIDYLAVCRESTGESSEGAMAAHDGILAVLNGRLPSFSMEYPCNSPTVDRWFTMEVAPLGTPERGVVVSHVDITERKRLEKEQAQVEAQLRQAQKMEALGTLAGGIAHDFNNILGIIFGYTEIALADSESPDSLRDDLHEVLKAGSRAKDLVQQILAFSRQSEQERRPVLVALIVKEALKMLRASLPATIQIKQNVSSRATVLADPTQIHQVLMNLCTNAAHAMQDGEGILEVGLADIQLEPKFILPHAELQSGPHVMLTVRDTGHGIDPSIAERIFDPFFTTKEQGVGTGLGLAVVHGIVKSLGGYIDVESSKDKGTTFRAYLPTMETIPVASEQVPVPLPLGRERVLIVDDEPALAMAMRRLLERLGYEVEYRSNGIEALQAFHHRPVDKPFDLVITDMTMPRMTGTQLAGELSKLQPRPVILLCTGFSERIDAEKARDIGIQGFIMKPVVLKELATMVRKVLDGRI